MKKVNDNMGKLTDGVLQYAPKHINYDNKWVFNPHTSILEELGYKPIVRQNYSEDTPIEDYSMEYAEDELNIYITYVYNPNPHKSDIEDDESDIDWTDDTEDDNIDWSTPSKLEDDPQNDIKW